MHISRLARPGDFVLIEGYEYGIKVPKKVKRKHYHIPRLVRMEGWENISALKIALDKQEEAKKLHKTFYNLSWNGPYAINMNSAWSAVETAIADSFLYAQYGRNPHLINNIRDAKAQFPNSKIFLVAGAKHFTEDAGLINALNEYKFTIQQIDNE